MTLSDRRNATRQTLERFAGRPFTWGEYDCGTMVVSHLDLLGYGDVIDHGGWATPIGLQRWLNRNGGSGAACLDGWLGNRIEPSRAIVGDIFEMPSDLTMFGSFAIAVGNGRILGWVEGVEGAAIVQPAQVLNAWHP